MKYTNNELMRIAKKYNSRREFSDNDSEAYQECRRRGVVYLDEKQGPRGVVFLDEACSHMKKITRNKITRDFCEKVAQKYWSESEFAQNEQALYYYARREGHEFLSSICKHMRQSRWGKKELTFEICLELAQTVCCERDFKWAYPQDYEKAETELWMAIIVDNKLFNPKAPRIDRDLDDIIKDSTSSRIIKDNIIQSVAKRLVQFFA